MDTRNEFAAFLAKIQSPSLYEGFDVSAVPLDEQGYQSPHNKQFFRDVFREFKPRCLLELGSWKGTSAIMFAKLMLEYCDDPVIACVDTWLGSNVHWADPETRKHLKLRHGFPGLYEVFIANLIRASVSQYVTPLPMTTRSAFQFCRDRHVQVNMAYVDASHAYADVLEDLYGAWDALGDEGVLVADDYNAPGVTKAIHEFCARPGVFGLTNSNVPWPQALIVKTAAMRDRAVKGHPALIDIPKP